MDTKSTYRIEQGNNLDVLKTLIAEGVLVDSVVTDPPYGIRFMGAKWDAEVPSVEFWELVLQILKPGGHLLACGGTRTYHRIAINIEEAGFEIRDCITWAYAQGMPKSRDVSKAIDEALGAERKVIGQYKPPQMKKAWNLKNANDKRTVGVFDSNRNLDITAPATPEAIMWDGWGTGLKPATEQIVLARKPLSERTVVENVLGWSTGALNIGACRIGTNTECTMSDDGAAIVKDKNNLCGKGLNTPPSPTVDGLGRWPANIIFDDAAAETIDEETPGASRYFRVIYCPKANKKERRGSSHPTVKPLGLMRELVKLVTPPGGTVLDPYAGTGTTGEAALIEGFRSILIELDAEYIKDIERRLASPLEVRTKQRKAKDYMKTVTRDEIGVKTEVERDEQGRRLIDCVACPGKRTPEAAFGLCFTCYRREKRAHKPKMHMHAQGQQKEQIRVTNLYNKMFTGAISLGMDDDDIRQLQLLLQPYLAVVPRLLKTADISFLFENNSENPDSVNGSQEAA